ncbi:ABC transporter ATP-binding protein [Nocardia sp. NPDC020380]|uniref:ABC transporter ATP-binding protein n=1 Tax=Nocardia sp. NPDC020380 TaxID=3364309 RepID=UPI0037AD0E49
MTELTLRVDSLTKNYADTAALTDVTFTLEPGRFLVLLGPSGSGKSTLLRCLAGIDRPDSGEIRFGSALFTGRRRHEFLPPERRELAMVFQDYALWPHKTARDNVAFALRRTGLRGNQMRERAARMLERVGLLERADHFPHQLSGGEQQRVALARALVAEPRLLLFDEPLSNLDADLRERLRVEIATLTRESGATVVYITHDQAEALALADEIGIMREGRLVQYGLPQDVYHRPASPFVARFTGLAGELAGRVESITGHDVRVRVGEQVIGTVTTERLAVGAAVRVLVRPTATTLAAPESGCGIAGSIRDTAYRGRGYDHVVELACGTRFTGVFDVHPRRRGDNVRLALEPAGCLTFGGADTASRTTNSTEPSIEEVA